MGVYLGYVNQFNFGAFMGKCVRTCSSAYSTFHGSHLMSRHTSTLHIEKGLTMKAGQTPVQRYWEMLLKKVEDKVRAG